jgi:hypothetical protein
MTLSVLPAAPVAAGPATESSVSVDTLSVAFVYTVAFHNQDNVPAV